MSELDSGTGTKVTIDKATCSTEQNVQFVDLVKGPMASKKTVEDPTVNQTLKQSADLGAFLSRPVKIDEIDILTGTFLNYDINPWNLWSSDPFVATKLNNFAYFRGDLMIKVVVNGNPFIYGKQLISYMPLHQARNIADPSGSTDQHLISQWATRSQRPHLIVDYSTDAGGCLCLPFLWPTNAVRVSHVDDWEALGDLNIFSLLPPRIATAGIGGNARVSVSIYAWAVNPSLTVPTYSLARSQGGDEHDREGLVSQPAAAIAAAAASLSSVPVIGPFAMASSIAAGAVSGIAALFGYSKPANVDAPATIRRDPANQLTNTTGVDSTNPLTFDPKSTVTIWSGVTGVDDGDEMALDYLQQRESIFQAFDWSPTTNPGTRIFWAGVHPNETPCHWVAPAARVHMFPTPLGFVSTPFGRWSGSIKYRFEICASRLHRGRLKVSWDPVSLTGASAVDNIGVTYSKVIDLTESRNLEFTVAWGRPELFLPMNSPEGWYCEDFHNGTGSTTGYFNGFISVTVLNRLTAPLETVTNEGDVRILCWVSAGDDFEVQLPTDFLMSAVNYRPNFPGQQAMAEGKMAESQGGDLESDAAEENTTEATQHIDLLVDAPVDVRKDKDMICYGETIRSFRNAVKRYMYHSTLFTNWGAAPDAGATFLSRFIRSDFPSYKGYSSNGLYVVNAPANDDYQVAHTTLLNYLTPAYKCRRGGLRQMLVPFLSTNREGGCCAVTVTRDTEAAVEGNVRTTGFSAPVDFSTRKNPVELDVMEYDSGFAGMWTTKTDQQGVVKFQTPYYCSSRFVSGDYLDVELGDIPGQDMETLKHVVTTLVPLNQPQSTSSIPTKAAGTYRRLVAASDDFSLSFFINAPAYYFDRTIPVVASVKESLPP